MRCQLYRQFAEDGTLLYVGVSLNTAARLISHRAKSDWYPRISKLTIETFETREAALMAEAKAIDEEKPICNKIRGIAIVPMPLCELTPLEQFAIAKGAKQCTIRKWRQRKSIPHRWIWEFKTWEMRYA